MLLEKQNFIDKLIGLRFTVDHKQFFPTNRISAFFCDMAVRQNKFKRDDGNIIPIYSLNKSQG